mgnify:FL=1
MVKGIHIIKYRKLENMELEFSKGINVLSGTNGTCKTSLLHIISNAFQAVTKKCEWLTDASCLDVIRQVNNMTNPKIESLTKGDKTHNDPANGIKGTIFSVDYYGHTSLEFRKHNSKLNNRYAVKPWYRPGTTEKLPYCPVIYLGLTRLYPFGEYMNDEAVQKLKKNLPEEYQNIISTIYNSLTGINISSVTSQKMGDIKTRADFESDKDGIDSNTISAGEDNLFIIICALVSLRYYFERITSTNEIESILLIDEFDATLHPSLQERLLKIFRQYSEAYKIQIIFTTHSLSTVDAALKSRDNVIYLIDNVTNAIVMESPDIYKIRRHLSGITGDDIYLNKSIPIFTEDAEARVFLNTLFDYFENTTDEFPSVRRFFHLVDANIGCTNLKSIFSDSYLLQTTMKCACVLDGDQSQDMNKYIITLPGGDSPEKVIMSYVQMIYDNDSTFWTNSTILELNYGKAHFRDDVKPDIDDIGAQLRTLRESGESTHGKDRELRKKVFLKHQRFFELLFKHWVRDEENADAVNKFYKNLNIIFKKVAEFHGINPQLWTVR